MLSALAVTAPLVLVSALADAFVRSVVEMLPWELVPRPLVYEGYVGYRGGGGYTPTGYIGTPTYRAQADRYRYQYDYAKRAYSPPQSFQYVQSRYPTAARAYASSYRGRVVHDYRFRR